MKETNMEHYRCEIENLLELDDEGELFAVVNGSPVLCFEQERCFRCELSDKPSTCAKSFIKWLMSEYKPEPVLTAREKGFVEFAQEGWLARDISGVLHWFMRKPDRCEDEDYRCWNGPIHAVAFKKLNEIFPFITWEDEEPWAVADLRKLKVKGGVADD